MSFLKNSANSTAVRPLYLNKYRRAISDHPAIPISRERFVSDATIVYLPMDNITVDNNENSFNEPLPSDDAFTSNHTDVRITIQEQPITSAMRKMHPFKAWHRRTIPTCVTCHQMWLVIHALVVITLSVLYFTHIIQISAGTLAICELLFGILVRNEIFIAFLHRLVALIPCFKYEFNRMLHCVGGLHVSSAIGAFF
jgi:hypothetical protein